MNGSALQALIGIRVVVTRNFLPKLSNLDCGGDISQITRHTATPTAFSGQLQRSFGIPAEWPLGHYVLQYDFQPQ